MSVLSSPYSALSLFISGSVGDRNAYRFLSMLGCCDRVVWLWVWLQRVTDLSSLSNVVSE